jgi:adenosine deaminase
MTKFDFKAFPKVALHDHLDGGLRPQTLLELSREQGLALPADNAQALALEIANRANSGSLTQYLEAFNWTLPVMQTEAALTRIAREAVEDLAADGVVLAEIRFAPLLHTAQGMLPHAVVAAVVKGLEQGSEATGVPVGLILCAIRSNDEFDEVAALFEYYHHELSTVVGLDLAGPEAGFPISAHPGIARFVAKWHGRAPLTLHAGEAAGVESIWQAVKAGARRIGHGTRLIDDILADRALLKAILEQKILLEVCLTSNPQTGCVPSIGAHPLPRFIEEQVLASLNVDNRLVSATTHSEEHAIAYHQLGLSLETLRTLNRNALAASFLPTYQRMAVATKYPELRPV